MRKIEDRRKQRIGRGAGNEEHSRIEAQKKRKERKRGEKGGKGEKKGGKGEERKRREEGRKRGEEGEEREEYHVNTCQNLRAKIIRFREGLKLDKISE